METIVIQQGTFFINIRVMHTIDIDPVGAWAMIRVIGYVAADVIRISSWKYYFVLWLTHHPRRSEQSDPGIVVVQLY